MKENTDILVSIITVNYKQAGVTNQLLNSLQKLNWKNIEVIVVDNGYDGKEKVKISDNYNNVTVVKSEKNLGFAGGNNIGIQKSKGQYILLLNNDTEVPADFIDHMVALLESNPNIGAVSPLIKYWDSPNLIQYAGFTKLNKITQRVKAKAHKQEDIGQFTQPEETYFAHGCAMMVPRKVIRQVGLMNEDYFLYYEEHDWSQRIKAAGYQIYFQPKSVVLHKESVSTGRESTLKTYFLNRNRILFMRLHSTKINRLLSHLYLYGISIPFNTINYFLRGKYQHLSAYLDAIAYTLTCKTKEQWKF